MAYAKYMDILKARNRCMQLVGKRNDGVGVITYQREGPRGAKRAKVPSQKRSRVRRLLTSANLITFVLTTNNIWSVQDCKTARLGTSGEG